MKNESVAKTCVMTALRCGSGALLLYLSLGLLLAETRVDALLHNGTALMLGGLGIFLICRGVIRGWEARRGVAAERKDPDRTAAYISDESHLAELLREEEEA